MSKGDFTSLTLHKGGALPPWNSRLSKLKLFWLPLPIYDFTGDYPVITQAEVSTEKEKEHDSIPCLPN